MTQGMEWLLIAWRVVTGILLILLFYRSTLTIGDARLRRGHILVENAVPRSVGPGGAHRADALSEARSNVWRSCGWLRSWPPLLSRPAI
jgi:hypothetical protein